jgi:hypothetical protein
MVWVIRRKKYRYQKEKIFFIQQDIFLLSAEKFDGFINYKITNFLYYILNFKIIYHQYSKII